MLENAANRKSFEKNLDAVIDFYKDELDFSWRLNSACYLFSLVEKMAKLSLEDIMKYLRNLTNVQKMFMSLVITVMKLLLVALATNAVCKCSCLALRRTKTWLGTTMTQERLNNSNACYFMCTKKKLII